jgi:hypothetical protein
VQGQPKLHEFNKYMFYKSNMSSMKIHPTKATNYPIIQSQTMKLASIFFVFLLLSFPFLFHFHSHLHFI